MSAILQSLPACFSRALLQGLSRLPDRAEIMTLRQTARVMAEDRRNRSVAQHRLLHKRCGASLSDAEQHPGDTHRQLAGIHRADGPIDGL